MRITELKHIGNDTLYDAVYLTSLHFPFVSLYIDPNGECALTFKGELPEKEIQSFFFNMNPNINSDSKIEDERIEYNLDYTYRNFGQGFFTEIYTRDGWRY